MDVYSKICKNDCFVGGTHVHALALISLPFFAHLAEN